MIKQTTGHATASSRVGNGYGLRASREGRRHSVAPRTLRTLRARVSGVKGFWMNAVSVLRPK